MSISAHGRSRLYCVWRWSRGFCSALSPAIHIFAGLKVCIHAITPTQRSAAVAARQAAGIPSGDFTTGLNTTRTGIEADSSSPVAMRRAWSATCCSVSSPYRS